MENLKPIVPGEVVQLSERIRRVTAPNPGMMTGPGTNTYIIGGDALALIDPGPESAAHFEAMRAAVGERLRWILCTHTHLDHSPGARALKHATGAEVIGMRAPQHGSQDAAFAPDRVFKHGDVLDGGDFKLRAVHTPGHASNHLCYLLEPEKLLFTGDHVMQGSTVVIAPPDGDMVAYFESLHALLALDLARIAPGHGHPIDEPHDEARRLIAHRLKREQKVIAALSKNPATLDELVTIVYSDTPQRLHQVARRSLHAHLIKLAREGSAVESNERWQLRD
ncbi:MAG TPA: MBL fold metallo-hydrolase [Burkholderiales bacterium]|jgi:glyoxylase-like metal-dependent hydrolase (beta-lactamase superfamily II)|nr:MBL fold metallo-hydrolase [Burkholderiales bacterium]